MVFLKIKMKYQILGENKSTFMVLDYTENFYQKSIFNQENIANMNFILF